MVYNVHNIVSCSIGLLYEQAELIIIDLFLVGMSRIFDNPFLIAFLELYHINTTGSANSSFPSQSQCCPLYCVILLVAVAWFSYWCQFNVFGVYHYTAPVQIITSGGGSWYVVHIILTPCTFTILLKYI